MRKQRTIRRGGIIVLSDVHGNLTIHARGDGQADVQNADVPDLILALKELQDASALEDTDVDATDEFKKV